MTLRPTITAARFALDAQKLEGSTIQALDRPYQAGIVQYRNALGGLLPPSERDGVGVPYRRLNRALLAVTPILGTGFEWMGDVEANRALIVNPPGRPAWLLSIEQIAGVMRGWAGHWIEQMADDRRFRTRDADGRERRRAAEDFQAVLREIPDTQWRPLTVQELLENLGATGYKAIPVLIAAILHGQSCEIDGNMITWNRVIGDGMQAAVQSQPLAAVGKESEGFFSYVLSITLQTQTGRAEPWIYMRPSIRRYADAAVTLTNYDRNVAILVRANRARIDDYPIDGSLVYLLILA